MHDLNWFKVGKKIKRDAISDCCEDCRKPKEFVIADENHAKYLHMTSHELNIKYYD